MEESEKKINMDKAYSAFRDYVEKYDPKNPKISLKIAHILRTAKVAQKLADSMSLSFLDIKLAELIGLLHDIGRFEQIRRYDTFADRDSIDHGDFGCEILFSEGLIRKFIKDDSYDSIIENAVKNHNKFSIDSSVCDERTLLHAKVVRDADKIDIFRVIVEDPAGILHREDAEKAVLSDEVYEDFLREEMIRHEKLNRGVANLLACYFAYVYDINFSESYRIILDDGFLFQMGETRFLDKDTHDRIRKVRDLAVRLCEEKSKEKSRISF